MILTFQIKASFIKQIMRTKCNEPTIPNDEINTIGLKE